MREGMKQKIETVEQIVLPRRSRPAAFASAVNSRIRDEPAGSAKCSDPLDSSYVPPVTLRLAGKTTFAGESSAKNLETPACLVRRKAQ
jgi:hypothetical protein